MKKKQSDVFPQQVAEKTSQENDSAEPKTPTTLSDVKGGKSKVVATPFYTAVNCSKCRYDKLGTSSHWIGQIKMAESAGKHVVASEFFRLAFEYPAEVRGLPLLYHHCKLFVFSFLRLVMLLYYMKR